MDTGGINARHGLPLSLRAIAFDIAMAATLRAERGLDRQAAKGRQGHNPVEAPAAKPVLNLFLCISGTTAASSLVLGAFAAWRFNFFQM
jgi:hypothetical protein